MKYQNFQIINKEIKEEFIKQKKIQDIKLFKNRLKLSWSNWGFGVESLEDTAKRLKKFGIRYIELHGNRYGADLGYKTIEVKEIMSRYQLEVAGICGMFTAESELSSNSPIVRQRVIDYIRRNLELGYELGAKYFLVAPGAIGRPIPYDNMEFYRSVDTLQIVADEFIKSGIRGAVEPIRSAEVSFCHTFQDAKEYIASVNSRE